MWADLAKAILENSKEIYTVTSPSFDKIPIMSEKRAKEWMEWLNMNYGNTFDVVTLEEFQESFYEKQGRLEARLTYQTNKAPQKTT